MNDKFISSGPIGPQIARLRREKGLSIEEVARAAGTSTPSLHRYESGWDRFEVRTLRRICRALDAHLEIVLRPRPTEASRPPTANELVRLLDPLFWDHDLAPSDLVDHPVWVVGRVLMYGEHSQVRAVRRYFGDDAIRQAIGQRGMDPRTRNYWEIVLAS